MLPNPFRPRRQLRVFAPTVAVCLRPPFQPDVVLSRFPSTVHSTFFLTTFPCAWHAGVSEVLRHQEQSP